MDLQTIAKQIELVQDCYHKVAQAQSDWNAYRRTAGAHGEATPELMQFVSLMRTLTDIAEELDRRREAVQTSLYGTGILQADIVSPDGKRKRSIVIIRPTDKIHEPHISLSAYQALCTMLGNPLSTTSPFDIAVIDAGRVTEYRIKTKGENK